MVTGFTKPSSGSRSADALDGRGIDPEFRRDLPHSRTPADPHETLVVILGSFEVHSLWRLGAKREPRASRRTIQLKPVELVERAYAIRIGAQSCQNELSEAILLERPGRGPTEPARGARVIASNTILQPNRRQSWPDARPAETTMTRRFKSA
jgi:hypothetical protein